MPTTNGSQGAGKEAAPGQQPQLSVLGQYVKDFSFENPNAPRSLQPAQQQPQINIQVNVNARPLAETDFEVELKIDGRAESQGLLIFAVELLYAGIFRIKNVPQESIHPLVMIECPRLLFPFARQMIADTTCSGGFPPLLIDPVDFVGLYRQKMAETAAAQQQNPVV